MDEKALQAFDPVHHPRRHQQRLTYRAVKQTKVNACEATAESAPANWTRLYEAAISLSFHGYHC
jgi:hypothetical protein